MLTQGHLLFMHTMCIRWVYLMAWRVILSLPCSQLTAEAGRLKTMAFTDNPIQGPSILYPQLRSRP